jgi:hypothetical protein
MRAVLSVSLSSLWNSCRYSFQGFGVTQDALHGSSADAQLAGNLRRANAAAVELQDSVSLPPSRWGTPPILTFSLGLLNPSPLPLQHKAAFEIGNCPEHGEQQLPGGRLGVGGSAAEIQNAQPDAFPVQPLDNPQQISDGAAQPV